MGGRVRNDDQEEDIVAEINMTPLIDIMLVLLIIFMVSSSINLDSGLNIDLPKTSSKSKGKTIDPKSVIVSLDKKGQLAVQGIPVNNDELFKQAVAQSLKEHNSTMVVFEGDQHSTLGRTIELMDLAKSAGAVKFAIAADSN
jgi:biopolymer transport protein ExbD